MTSWLLPFLAGLFYVLSLVAAVCVLNVAVLSVLLFVRSKLPQGSVARALSPPGGVRATENEEENL